jgi:hypothetical protein
MNMKNLKMKLAALASMVLVCFVSVSCVADLDQAPEDSSSLLTSEEFFKNPDSYKQFLAKLYAGLATTGQSGPAGSADISFIDEGFSQYIRGYWQMQELTTDEAIMAWNDLTIKNFHYQNWTPTDVFINATFSRLAFQITNCNEFLRQTTDAKLDSRSVSSDLRAQIQTFRAEARFLRALSYWHLIDLFGGASIVTEDSPTSYFLPEYATRAQLFEFVESELAEIESEMADPNSNEIFRADRTALWMLQGKLFMNANVYIGQDRYTDAQTALEKIFNQSSYALHDNYRELFLADNDTNGAQNEFIFAVAFDGLNTKTYGGTTFLTHAPVGGNMPANEFGINGGWAGIRTTSAFVAKFDGMDGDARRQFHTSGQTLEIADVGNFNHGYAIAKWRNVDSMGNPGSDAEGNFADTDFPMFRLADAYLMYAECALRGAGNLGQAVNYVNMLRERAYGNNSANITAGALTLDFVLDERARELHWEGHRRTDLIRHGKFTGSAYVWAWKGNVPGGAPTPSYRNLFPIPSNAISANPNLQQNPGY